MQASLIQTVEPNLGTCQANFQANYASFCEREHLEPLFSACYHLSWLSMSTANKLEKRRTILKKNSYKGLKKVQLKNTWCCFQLAASAPQQCWVSLCFSCTMPFGKKALKPKSRPSSFGDVIKGFCQCVLRKQRMHFWALYVKHSVKHAVSFWKLYLAFCHFTFSGSRVHNAALQMSVVILICRQLFRKIDDLRGWQYFLCGTRRARGLRTAATWWAN